MLSLLYALALSSTVGSCTDLSAATDSAGLDAYYACASAQISAELAQLNAEHAAAYDAAIAQVQGRQHLERQRAIHAAEYRDSELRVAAEQQRVANYAAQMQRINQQYRAAVFNPYFTVVGPNGRVSTWRVIDLW